MRSLHRLKRPSLMVGSAIILVFAAAAIFAPVLAPPVGDDSPMFIPKYGNDPVPSPPRPGFPLGLLSFQFDVFYGLVWGARAAFWIGLSVPLGRALVGAPLGLLSGYYRGPADSLMMRLTDAFMAFPMIAAMVVMLSLFGFERQLWDVGVYITGPSRQDQVVILTLIIFGWMPYARLIRGNVLAEREKTYVEAARSIGVPSRRLVSRHLFPNSIHGLIALITFDVGATVVLVASFTFIGLIGQHVGTIMEADWGEMLYSGRNWIVGAPGHALEYWYTFLPICIAIVLFSTGWSLIGDGLRDALDPRYRSSM